DLSGYTGVRVEWLKARARAQRWEEEVRLLRVEMERTLVTFSHMSTWWEGRTERTEALAGENQDPEVSVEQELKEGLLAYAGEHADMYLGLREAFEERWMVVRQAALLFLARKSILDEA
ncbi:uncharacterized protein STEHIDRAFT_68684, partial [Stereum hirsutum FP-91666 SS1]